jgi:tetratricopeptide (TPR) repeat protein
VVSKLVAILVVSALIPVECFAEGIRPEPSPGVVIIETYGADHKHLGRATGFVLTKDRLVTACHVIMAAKDVQINLGAEGMVSASVWNADIEQDIAILVAAVPDAIHGLSIDTSRPVSGDTLTIITKNAKGEEQRIEGICILERTDPIYGVRTIIRPDCRPGDSGAPVLNSAGRVAALITSGWSTGDATQSMASPLDTVPHLVNSGREQSVEGWNAANSTSSEKARTLWDDALRAIKIGNPASAINDLEVILESRPNDFEALTVLCSLYSKANLQAKLRDAMDSWNERGVRPDLLRLTRAGLAYGRASYREAVAEIESLRPDQQSAKAMEVLGSAKAQIGDLSGARAAYQAATGLAPSDPDAWRELCQLEWRLRNVDAAIAGADRWAALEWSDEPLVFRGQLLESKGDELEAIAAYTLAKQRNPQSAKAYHLLGRADARRKEFDAAIDELKHARQLAPGSALIGIELARVFEATQRWDEAKALLESLQPQKDCESDRLSLLALACHAQKDEQGEAKALELLRVTNPYEYNRTKDKLR